MSLETTPFKVAGAYLGVKEVAGPRSHPMVAAFHYAVDDSDTPDEVPWCSSFANFVAWSLGLPRSRSRRARSWLKMGRAVELGAAVEGDVVVFSRGEGPQPGPEVLEAPGHVAFLGQVSKDGRRVWVCGGNQGDSVSHAWFPASQVLGVRRLYEAKGAE